MHCYCFAALDRYKKKRDRSLKWGERKTGSERLRSVRESKGMALIRVPCTFIFQEPSGRKLTADVGEIL